MYNDGINNDFEHAHQKGLRRGFDLGWSYKGRFDRQIIRDEIKKLEKQYNKHKSNNLLQIQINCLYDILKKIKENPNNRENITFNSW